MVIVGRTFFIESVYKHERHAFETPPRVINTFQQRQCRLEKCSRRQGP